MTEVFKKKLSFLSHCIHFGNFMICADKVTKLAEEMGVKTSVLLDLSKEKSNDRKYKSAYVLGLAASQISSEKELARAYFAVAYAAQYIGKLEEAEKYYKKAIEKNPQFNYAHLFYAILLSELNRKAEALEHYEIGKELDLQIPADFLNIAIVLEKLDMIAEAEEHYKKAIELNPKFIEALISYAIFLQELDKTDESELYFKKAIEAKPKSSDAHTSYALLLKEKNQLHEAESEVRFALQINPENPHTLRILGDILTEENLDLKEAENSYNKAIENKTKLSSIRSNSIISEIHNNLGWIYTQSNQYKKADDEFKKAIKYNPMNIKALQNKRALEKRNREVEPKISKIQKYIAIILVLFLILIFICFLMNKISDNIFCFHSTILIALLIFILLFDQLVSMKTPLFEFESSSEKISQHPEYFKYVR